ncbi:helix-turn-helix domain-containing protein [Rathayibacter sp. VKM Ac-2857]|uniref:winged helix-turn-helix transcriptional regulator n=1 Tax=Rathayibacter sp. VKM Ac-2857 TaxID=2739020 RepID=UPI0015630177|nr:winged helix-turn-helix transcriptional regulator [Rathayibacter sp. VKM Ac-2857]NQX18311.1 winged helix-turn-helix transcriptional regulator [Rathayibacter sp. VKM Ac-2857]
MLGLLARRRTTREVVPSVPVQISYRLTKSGDELIRILHPLVRWAHRHEPSGKAHWSKDEGYA